MILLLILSVVGCVPTKTAASDVPSVVDTGEETGTDPTDPLANIDAEALPAGINPCRSPAYVTVEEVVDGDTIEVLSGRGAERVRLIGIDAAEVDHNGDWDECWAEEALAHVAELIEGTTVWLTFDAECEDDYGRALAYVHTRPGDQGFLQRVLLSEGWVTTFEVSPNNSFANQFLQDETAAMVAGAGLWGACGR